MSNLERRGPLNIIMMTGAEEGATVRLILEGGERIAARVTWVEKIKATHLIKVHAEREHPGNKNVIDLIEIYHYTDLTPDAVWIRPSPIP